VVPATMPSVLMVVLSSSAASCWVLGTVQTTKLYCCPEPSCCFAVGGSTHSWDWASWVICTAPRLLAARLRRSVIITSRNHCRFLQLTTWAANCLNSFSDVLLVLWIAACTSDVRECDTPQLISRILTRCNYFSLRQTHASTDKLTSGI